MENILTFSSLKTGKEYPIDFACRIAKTAILCFGPLDYSILKDDHISVNGNSAAALRLGTIVESDGTRNTLFIFTFSNASGLDALNEIHIERDGIHTLWKSDRIVTLANSEKTIGKLLGKLSEEGKRKAFFLLSRLGTMKAAMARDSVYTRTISDVRAHITTKPLETTNVFWASAHMLCFEVAPNYPEWSTPQLCITTGSGAYLTLLTPCLPWQGNNPMGNTKHLLCAWFDKDITKLLRSAQYTITDGTSIVPLTVPPVTANSSPMKLLEYLKQFSTHEQQTMREQIMQMLLSFYKDGQNREIKNIVFTLQHFIHAPHTSVTGISDPIGINVEYALPVGEDKLFIHGWTRDPYKQIDSIEAIADLGFNVTIDKQLRKFPREDIRSIYEKQDMRLEERCGEGFTALVTIPESVRASYKHLASPLQYRFRIKLRSDIEYYVTPRTMQPDNAGKRDEILQQVVPETSGNDAAEEVVSDTLLQLQQLATDKPTIRNSINFGESPAYPTVSLVIPVFGCMEFIPAQIVHFAQDPFLSTCEIIYVLDQPSREVGFRELLKNLHDIHGIPLKLITLEQNYGYAAASNVGVKSSQGTHICFLNSDVMPKHYGWLEEMWNYYSEQETIGAVGPTLLFENDSIQHGGMHIDTMETPYVAIRHFGKGRGVSWLETQEIKEVPAVTGACMLMEKSLFEEIGGFDGNFLFGDFEDAHICLKLAEKGLKNTYLPQVSLYHCERQSIPMLDSYEDNIAFPINSRRFYKRWKHRIDLMNDEGTAS